jgi:hypothetical protein
MVKVKYCGPYKILFATKGFSGPLCCNDEFDMDEKVYEDEFKGDPRFELVVKKESKKNKGDK